MYKFITVLSFGEKEIKVWDKSGIKETNVEFRRLSSSDGADIYDMLQELPPDENGYINNISGKTFEEFKQWLIRQEDIANGIGLADWMVPQTTYWLYVGGIPVGTSKLRSRLTDRLREDGGHAGYSVRPSQRNKGYGKLMLRLLIEEAGQQKLAGLLLTVRISNIPSLKVAVACGGKIEKTTEQRHYIWIDTQSLV